jgi:transposase
MDFHLNSLLNLPNTTVFTCYKEVEFIFIHLQLNNEGINCPNCQNYTDIVHQTSHILIRDWLSLDEFSRRKADALRSGFPTMQAHQAGKGQFATVLVDLDKSSWLEVIDSHKSDDIITALKQQPESVRDSVKEVCVDMWGGFPKVIKEVFPNAAITIDRFHVMKLVNKSLNKLRLALDLKGLKNRGLLLSNNQSLSEQEIQDLSELLARSPLLSIA